MLTNNVNTLLSISFTQKSSLPAYYAVAICCGWQPVAAGMGKTDVLRQPKEKLQKLPVINFRYVIKKCWNLQIWKLYGGYQFTAITVLWHLHKIWWTTVILNSHILTIAPTVVTDVNIYVTMTVCVNIATRLPKTDKDLCANTNRKKNKER